MQGSLVGNSPQRSKAFTTQGISRAGQEAVGMKSMYQSQTSGANCCPGISQRPTLTVKIILTGKQVMELLCWWLVFSGTAA